jgi:nucleotide-binding universal stress UspA family protein
MAATNDAASDAAGTLPTAWREILVPVRGGPDATARVELALRLAAGVQARVTALYVIDDRLLGDPDAALVREELQGRLSAEGENVLRAVGLLASLRAVPLTTRMERGPVIETILKIADEIGADAIVVGSHKQTWLGRLLGTSVAEAILRGAKCTVLAVPPAAAPTKK